MATFVATTASSTPLLKDVGSVTKLMERYCWDSDVAPMIQTDAPYARPRLAIHGYDWPRAWSIPDGRADASNLLRVARAADHVFQEIAVPTCLLSLVSYAAFAGVTFE
jgi:hypothetical protein